MIAEPDELMKVLKNEHTNISKSIKSYIKSKWKSLNVHSVDISCPNNVACKSVDFDHICILRVDNERVCFTADASIEIKMTGMSVHGPAKDTDFIWLRLDCSCSNSEPGRYCFESKVICQLGTEPHETVYSLPHITDKNAGDYAELFLEKYCPDALKTPMKINVKDIAAKMGLTIVEQNDSSHTSDDYRLEGDIGTGKSFCTLTFEAKNSDDMRDIDSTGTIKRLTNGTITVNPANEKYNFFGTHDIAVLNQLIHWMFHHKYFETLQSGRYDNPTEMPGNYTYLVADNLTCSPLMEPQSMMLIPRIMIPTKTGRDKFQSIYDDVKANDPQLRSAVIMEKAVEQFADFYGVPVQMAKQRAVDFGFEQAVGTFIEARGKKCPPVSFAAGSLQFGLKFLVGDDNCIRVIKKDRTLSVLYENGMIVNSDGYWVVNDRKYVSVLDYEVYELTEYALEHLTECAVIVVCSEIGSRALDRYYYDTGKDYCFDPDDLTDEMRLSLQDSEKKLKDYDQRINNLKTFPHSFYKTLKELMEIKGINRPGLSSVTSISETTIGNYLNENTRDDEKPVPSLYSVLKICAGMKLEPEYTYDLIKKRNYSIEYETEENNMFRFLVTIQSPQKYKAYPRQRTKQP